MKEFCTYEEIDSRIDDLLKKENLCENGSFCDETMNVILQESSATKRFDILIDTLLRKKLRLDFPHFADITIERIRHGTLGTLEKFASYTGGIAIALCISSIMAIFTFNTMRKNMVSSNNYSYFSEISERTKEIVNISKLLAQEEMLDIFKF